MNEPAALNTLGNLYKNGQGVEQSFEKAIEYYEKAADLGCTNALINLGDLFENGDNPDYSKSIRYYQKAEESGNSFARTRLDELQKKTRKAK